MSNTTVRRLFAAFFAIALLSGCSESDISTPSDQVHELVYATAKDINDMNPHLYPGSMAAQGIVYESLVENTKDGIKPLLAESWDISDDGKVYTFHLRKGVSFHDGTPFNADAVKQNIEAVQRNASKHTWIKLSSKLKDVSIIDEHTVQLTLAEPYYPTLLELSMTRPYVFLSPNDFQNGETKDGVKGFNGTGPYKLAEHVTDQYARFQANESYWGGSPKVKQITAKVLPSGETTLLALQKGEVNFVFTDDRGTDSIDVDAMNRLTASGKYKLVRSEPMNTKMIVANSSKSDSPVSEKAVREAIWHSIDRTTISQTIFSGTEAAAETLFSSNVAYANIPLKKRGYDPEAAKRLLEQAGWIAAKDGEVRMKGGHPLTMKLYYDANSSSQKTQAELIQNEVSKIGMKLELIGEESSSIANRRSKGDYDLLFNQSWGLAYDPQSTIAAFASESSYLHATSGISSAKELYQKIDEVMVAKDEKTRQALYADILTSVHNEAVFIPLTNGSITVVAPTHLQGVSFKQTQFELPFERMHFE
ncbi:nickel ABC transporter, nickel/metallophore periplasmic binding protein [Brevibacillus nitrificans]|uniref:Nickel ABC transporter, nickel/metallophore periplasmic binding protein n=1 Tax=Brevibacillus nitrificans TaxID=651560 RepID=A0A3M8DF17_9BACL|nr:nickel ABC transporter substrate-binding protein [Brevibacillus nitrificans]RNB86740.1 nickel ABC transporter, nickel/metallophore periplasmic binding protein [Brevibacillus nitrificans]